MVHLDFCHTHPPAFSIYIFQYILFHSSRVLTWSSWLPWPIPWYRLHLLLMGFKFHFIWVGFEIYEFLWLKMTCTYKTPSVKFGLGWLQKWSSENMSHACNWRMIQQWTFSNIGNQNVVYWVKTIKQDMDFWRCVYVIWHRPVYFIDDYWIIHNYHASIVN